MNRSDSSLSLIYPDWPAPGNVKSFMTTRAGGVSAGAYASLNLGSHVEDDPQAVAENRKRLSALLPSEPVWLSQVHGIDAVNGALVKQNVEADACYTTAPNRVSCVMTADCLPVLFCNREGNLVASAHAGWRGLLAGVLEGTLCKFNDPSSVLVWFGAAIGPKAFEVGSEVRMAFINKRPEAATHFKIKPNGKYLADIYGLARQRLVQAGVPVDQIYGGALCTVSDSERFFSFRRDGQTGRMATCIWLAS